MSINEKCYFKIVPVIRLHRVLGTEAAGSDRPAQGKAAISAWLQASGASASLPPTTLIQFLDVTSREPFVTGANV